MRNYLIVVLFVFIFTFPVFANRPLITDDFNTLAAGKNELEAGFTTITSRTASASTSMRLNFSFNRGFTDRFEMGLVLPYQLTDPAGLDNGGLYAKCKLFTISENEGLSFKLKLQAIINGATASGNASWFNYIFTAIYSKSILNFKTHYNLGYALSGKPGGSSQLNSFNYSAALEKELRPDLEIFTEYYAVAPVNNFTSNLNLGGRWQISEQFRFDVGYSLGGNDVSNNIATIGMTASL